MLGDGGGTVAVDHPGDGGDGAGRVLRRGEHGAVGALGGGDAVGRERERDRRPRRAAAPRWPRGAGWRTGGGRGGGRATTARTGRAAVVRRRAGPAFGAAGLELQDGQHQRRGGAAANANCRRRPWSPAHRASMASAGGEYRAPMVTTRDISYEADGRTMVGTLAVPDGSDRRARRPGLPRGPGPRRPRARPGRPAGRRARLRRLRSRLPRRRPARSRTGRR